MSGSFDSNTVHGNSSSIENLTFQQQNMVNEFSNQSTTSEEIK